MPSKIISVMPVIKGVAKAIRNQNPEFEPKLSIGAYFNKSGKDVARGLPETTLRLLMPQIILAEVTDRDYLRLVSSYFNELTHKIPVSGLELEIGQDVQNDAPLKLKVDGKEVVNYPLNPEHFIWYHHIKGHPMVARNKEEAMFNDTKLFYIHDEEVVQKVINSNSELEKEALTKLYAVDEDVKVCRKYLVLMGIDIKGVKPELYQAKLRDVVRSEPKLFLEILADAHSDMKYRIKQYIAKGVLLDINGRIVENETKVEIGGDLLEAVLYLSSKDNADKLRVYDTRLKANS